MNKLLIIGYFNTGDSNRPLLILRSLLILNFLFGSICAFAQTPRCETEFNVNIYNGTLNALLPNASKESVLKILPCLVQNMEYSDIPNPFGTEGPLFSKTVGVYFDFEHQYIEIDTHYTSKISVDILNKHFQYAVAILGKPFMRDLPAELEAQIVFYFYPTDYGCMRLNYDFNTGNLIGIAFHAKSIYEAMKDVKRDKYDENLEK
jgi:hypothetical protein